VTLHFGQIVIVSDMPDPDGVNPKDRPSVVVTPTDEIEPDGLIVVVLSRPYFRARHPTTTLNCPGTHEDIPVRAFEPDARP
jgi:hypothetical protein